MISNTTERAKLLIEQKRYKEAKQEIGNLLQSDPNDAEALCLLAIIFLEEKKYEEAEELVLNAIKINPSNSFHYYLHAQILFQLDKNSEAEKKVHEALKIFPYDAECFALLAAIKLHDKEWEKALDYANKGLEVDADNINCLNYRSTALMKLDRKEDSFNTIAHALNNDPYNAYTHANVGWALLEKGDHKKALIQFQESLKIDPTLDYAKAGLVEALKARYLFYRWFLKYAFWIGNMKGKAQWGVIIGFAIGSRVLRGIASAVPALKPFILPVVILYMMFAVSTWIIEPLTNLFLRLNVYGRYALQKAEIITSNFVGSSLLLGITSFILYYFTDNDLFFYSAIFGISMMIPLANMLTPPLAKNKKKLIVYAAGLGLTGISGLVLFALDNPAAQHCATIYILGIILYQWVANAILIR
ncbi:MAG: tetratricopeptide repeat protein [Cytophagaceae bacterium]